MQGFEIHGKKSGLYSKWERKPNEGLWTRLVTVLEKIILAAMKRMDYRTTRVEKNLKITSKPIFLV